MAINGINPYTKFRIGGLATGMDTDQIVTDLMRVERMPLEKILIKRQLAEWKRDDYRSITSLIRGFQSDFFDFLKPANNMRSQSTYQKYTSTSSDSTVVTATGGVGVTSTSHTIIVNGIATAASAVSTGTVSKALVGENVAAFEVTSYNNSFNITLNGITKEITLPNGSYANATAIIGNGSDGLLKQKVTEAFSSMDVVLNGSAIQFTSTNASDTISVSLNLVTDDLLSDLSVGSTGIGTAITFPMSIEKGRKFTISAVEAGITTTKEIEWAAATVYNDSTTLAADIQSMLDTAFGVPGKITVDGTGDKLTFAAGAGVDSITLSESQNNNKIMGNLGFVSGDSNRISLSDTLETVSAKLSAGAITFDVAGNFTLTINSKAVGTFNKTDTLSTLISTVNSSDAGVTMSYSSFTDKFTMTAKETGEATITLNDNGSGFFTSTRLTAVTDGTNAGFTLDGLAGSRTTNNFTIDGVTYTLLKSDPGVAKTIGLAQDTDTVYNSIKAFVDKYNEIIGIINGKLSEKYDRDYLPLSEEQKDAMNEDDIKKWEDRAKTGLIRNDSLISGMINDMRRALYDTFSGIEGNLSAIGITTGSYDERGKLVINEAKLKEAIKNTPDKVTDIFSKESDIAYSPNLNSTDKAERYSENGIIMRLYDIMQDNIRTTRDSEGRKGKLIEKAGITGDISEFGNLIYDEITGYNERINSLNDMLINKENRYYEKFAAMESIISKMNSQSNWLAAQLGTGS